MKDQKHQFKPGDTVVYHDPDSRIGGLVTIKSLGFIDEQNKARPYYLLEGSQDEMPDRYIMSLATDADIKAESEGDLGHFSRAYGWEYQKPK